MASHLPDGSRPSEEYLPLRDSVRSLAAPEYPSNHSFHEPMQRPTMMPGMVDSRMRDLFRPAHYAALHPCSFPQPIPIYPTQSYYTQQPDGSSHLSHQPAVPHTRSLTYLFSTPHIPFVALFILNPFVGLSILNCPSHSLTHLFSSPHSIS
ncbi:hypothetical protein BS47DRAFT_229584 [Hydnum rufescens UP504]|uniref:Uncharacterized protein n=1 Tax=Hydnum rufescens UP504 TaxID=1448309 RepID=A0A9P6AMA6_9AGAM|nr:hypothetical protein BS47DRAFT_229584 [Hydnum rufescens UP504]